MDDRLYIAVYAMGARRSGGDERHAIAVARDALADADALLAAIAKPAPKPTTPPPPAAAPSPPAGDGRGAAEEEEKPACNAFDCGLPAEFDPESGAHFCRDFHLGVELSCRKEWARLLTQKTRTPPKEAARRAHALAEHFEIGEPR